MTVPWCCVFVLFVWVLLVWSSLLLTVVGVVVVLVTAPNFLHGRLCQLPVPTATKANVPSDSETGSLYSTGWPGPRRHSAHCHEGRTVQTPRAGSHEGKSAGRSRVIRQDWQLHTHDPSGSGSMRSIQMPLTHLGWEPKHHRPSSRSSAPSPMFQELRDSAVVVVASQCR